MDRQHFGRQHDDVDDVIIEDLTNVSGGSKGGISDDDC